MNVKVQFGVSHVETFVARHIEFVWHIAAHVLCFIIDVDVFETTLRCSDMECSATVKVLGKV